MKLQHVKDEVEVAANDQVSNRVMRTLYQVLG